MSVVFVQLVPFQDSVAVTLAGGEAPSPPKAKAEVEIPAPPKPVLPVFKLFTSV